MNNPLPLCAECSKPFKPRLTGGRPQLYCDMVCKGKRTKHLWRMKYPGRENAAKRQRWHENPEKYREIQRAYRAKIKAESEQINAKIAMLKVEP